MNLTVRFIFRAQDGLVRLLGNTVAGRTPLVEGMLRRDASESAAYWLQLVVSIGIATLGLVVGSSAVVIGAMLVAPLMGPIVSLAMGLATGSPYLVMRSIGRVGASVAIAVLGAAGITRILPFHELNAEILARTSPTALDLATAAFCAIAGVYATITARSASTTTAAGTSIGISLVPPLCATGFGLGTSSLPIAGGAALLFLTNLVAIVVVGTVAFVAAGFNRVDVVTLEAAALEGTDSKLAGAIARRLSHVFATRFGWMMRVLMPFAFLAVVYVPLRSALDEVSWQVRTRAAVHDAIGEASLSVVQTRVRVERHEIDVGLVILGSAAEAEDARQRVSASVREASGVTPHVEVLAVPDAGAFAGLQTTLLTERVKEAPAPPPPPPPAPEEQLDDAHTWVRAVVDELWPSDSVGPPLAIEVGVTDQGPYRVRVTHWGPALSPDARESVQRALDTALGKDTTLVDVAIPKAELTRAAGDLSFVTRVATGVDAAAGLPGVSVCVSRPEGPARGQRPKQADVELGAALDAVLARHPKVENGPTGPWSIRFQLGACGEGVGKKPAPVPTN